MKLKLSFGKKKKKKNTLAKDTIMPIAESVLISRTHRTPLSNSNTSSSWQLQCHGSNFIFCNKYQQTYEIRSGEEFGEVAGVVVEESARHSGTLQGNVSHRYSANDWDECGMANWNLMGRFIICFGVVISDRSREVTPFISSSSYDWHPYIRGAAQQGLHFWVRGHNRGYHPINIIQLCW